MDNIAAAAPGSRNEVANREGYSLGGLIGAGRLDEDVVVSAMLDATVAAGWDNPEKTERTIRSAVASGKLAPRRHGLQDAVLFAMAPTHLPAANDETWQGPNGPSSAQLADALSRELTPPSDEEWEAAAQPDPHVFGDGESGLFPVGEVTVLGAPQRSGKTTLVVHLAAHIALGLPVVGLPCYAGRVVIYSREDDRKQYTRKKRGACSRFPAEQESRVRDAIITPNMRAPGLREASMLIDICEKRRRPIETAMVDGLIAALRPLVDCDDPVRLVVFETVSTLSHAEEDNKGLSALAAALKKVAQDLGIAVLVTHHLSQEGSKELRTLNLSTNMIRGATALVADTRQSLLQIDLGSDGDPLPKNDQREVFRRFLTQRPFDPHRTARFSALVPMDTSKARDPLPLFTAWTPTPFGPAMDAVSVPETIAGERWRKAQGTVSAWGDVQKAQAKGEQKNVTASAEIQTLLDAYDKTVSAGQLPTANAISKHIGRSMGWVQTRLSSAVELGLMKSSVEQVHRGPKEGTVVYRRVDGDCGSN